MEGTKKGSGERLERGRRTGNSGEESFLCAQRRSNERSEGMKAENEKESRGTDGPFRQ